MTRVLGIVLLLSVFVGWSAPDTCAQTTEFTLQGSLKDGANPANGNYDFVFVLFDSLAGGTQFGPTLSRPIVTVADGTFSVKLNFGGQFPGTNRFLEIRVRQTGGGAFTTLTPRQSMDSSPYSIQSLNATNAANALNATTATNALQLGGVSAGQYVVTTDPRMTDSRPPTAGSSSYIQNTTLPQASSDFNITGTGTANAFNAATQYNIIGNRILGANFGQGNLFVGLNAGLSTTGASNSFFGHGAGTTNSSGFANSFFGRVAGEANTTGEFNSFFGSGAGNQNTGGVNNSFFGANAGAANKTGGLNAYFGYASGINSTGSANAFFGGNTGVANTTGADNTFVGAWSGVSNISGNRNSFFGRSAGFYSTGNDNSFFGYQAGRDTVISSVAPSFGKYSGNDDSFFGELSGSDNSFFGSNAGLVNTIGFSNSFFGANAGRWNTVNGGNSFFGESAGLLNTTGNGNSFVGRESGFSNTEGIRNTFIGRSAGASNITGDYNTAIGAFSNVGSGNLTYATAIGGDAVVSTSNTVVLGRTADNVRVPGSLTVTGSGVGSSLHIVTNGGNVLIGNVGCSAPSNGISFSTVLICNNYSIVGDGTGTSINRPFGGNLDFRENNSVQMSIASGGIVSILNLGPAGATALCRNASNQIATCSSSARYKSNISPLTSGLSLINRLRPVSFNWRDGGMLDMGLVAEEVAAVEPLLTTTNAKGEVEGVKYDRVGVVLVNAVKEQQAQIEKLSNQVREQSAENQRLRDQIAALTKLVCLANPTAAICAEEKK